MVNLKGKLKQKFVDDDLILYVLSYTITKYELH